VEHFSLEENAREELERIRNLHLTDIICTSAGAEHPIREEKKLIAFRMIQECLQNILKHANATRISLTFTYEQHALDITIRDNGVGFNVREALDKSQGLGLQNIIHRAAIISGHASITSTIAEGATINLTIPYA
jgi:signal transduction histidine kinase